MNLGRTYKKILDITRSSKYSTLLFFGIKTHSSLTFNWDLTTLVLKKALKQLLPKNDQIKVLEMGCGHAAPLLQFLKKNYPLALISGADIYPEFTKNALLNIEKNNLNIRVYVSDLFSNIEGKFDLIYFNPPYVPRSDSSTVIKYAHTTYSGSEGTDTTLRFLQQARSHLGKNGKILLGINCFHISENKIIQLCQDQNYFVKSTFKAPFNTARAFLLIPNEKLSQL